MRTRWLSLSRPRFWIYLFGPYLIGLAASMPTTLTIPSLLFGLYFLYPANFLLYGINDVFDWETDRLNPKKQTYENVLPKAAHSPVIYLSLILTFPFFIYALFVHWQLAVILCVFLVLSIEYSAPPIRAKARPFIDAAFNGLYIIPGIFAYFLMSKALPSTSIILAGWLWTMAMHAYSAIPDIDADNAAKVPTIATQLRKRGTLLFCCLCYLLAGLLSFSELSWLAVILTIVYVLLMLFSWHSSAKSLFSLYTYFPWVNTAAGFSLFLFTLILHLG